ncbi:MAG: hypothetical protein WCK91_01325, partial [bacterium]
AVVNIDDLAEREARKAADSRMTESKESSNFLKKLWKHTFFDEYYRQKEVSRVRQEIEETGNIYAGRIDTTLDGRRNKGSIYGLHGSGPDKVAHNDAMLAISERFASDYDGTISDGEEKKLMDNADPKAVKTKADIKDLIGRYATGSMTDEVFTSEKGRILSGLRGEELLSGAGSYADNLFEIARNARLAIEHGATLDEIEFDTGLIIGKAKSALKTEAHFNTVDKLVDKMKKSKIGRFISPAVLSTGVGLAYSVSVGLGTRVLKSKATAYGTFGASVAISAALAGMNESQRLAEERKQHGLEMAEGQTYEEGSKRREQMEEYQYNMESAAGLTQRLQSAIESGDSSQVMSVVSQIEARNSINAKKKVDLISYSSIGSVEKERTSMTILVAKAKVDLRKKVEAGLVSGIPEGKTFDEYMTSLVKTTESSLLGGDAGLDAKDKAFSKYKAKRVIYKVGLTLVTGLVLGAIAQEGVALAKDKVQGLVEGSLGTGGPHVQMQTPLDHLRSWMSGHSTHTGLGHSINQSVSGHNFKLPPGTSLHSNSDGTFDILRDGHTVSSHAPIHFNANGDMDHASMVRLGKDGIVASNVHSVVGGTREVTVTADDYMKAHPEKMTHVVRSWMDNDTPMYPDPNHPGHLLGADLNELRTQWGGVHGTGIDANGDYVLNVQHMTNDGSFHDGLTVEAKDEIAKGHMEVLFSVTKGTQEHVIKGTIGTDGLIHIAKDSAEGKMLFANVGGHAEYNGAFIEIAKRSRVLSDGTEQMQILGTHIGTDHANSIKDIINDKVDTATTNLDMPVSTDTEPPYFIPLVWRSPLEKTKNKEKKAIVPPIIPSVIDGTYDETYTEKDYSYEQVEAPVAIDGTYNETYTERDYNYEQQAQLGPEIGGTTYEEEGASIDKDTKYKVRKADGTYTETLLETDTRNRLSKADGAYASIYMDKDNNHYIRKADGTYSEIYLDRSQNQPGLLGRDAYEQGLVLTSYEQKFTGNSYNEGFVGGPADDKYIDRDSMYENPSQMEFPFASSYIDENSVTTYQEPTPGLINRIFGKKKEKLSKKSIESYVSEMRAYLDSSVDIKMMEELDSQIGEPMDNNTRISVTLPCYREGEGIYKTLSDWTLAQKDLKPEELEIITFVNAPKKDEPLDEKTIAEINRFKLEHPNYKIRLVKHNFDFQKKRKMGAIYKAPSDLALYRNMKRLENGADPEVVASQLMRAGGADALGRNPRFLRELVDFMDSHPETEQLRTQSAYPPEIREKFPLFNMVTVFNHSLSLLYTRGNSNIGLGTFRARAYASASGFDANREYREEIDLGSRIREKVGKKDGAIMKLVKKNAIDNPRRELFALANGDTVLRAYTDFSNPQRDTVLRSFDESRLSIDNQKNLEMSAENMSREFDAYLQHYLGKVLRESGTITQILNGELNERTVKSSTLHPETRLIFRDPKMLALVRDIDTKRKAGQEITRSSPEAKQLAEFMTQKFFDRILYFALGFKKGPGEDYNYQVSGGNPHIVFNEKALEKAKKMASDKWSKFDGYWDSK